MRILSFLIAVLLAFGVVIWPGWIRGHPVWGPWTTESAAVPTPPAEPDTPVTTPNSTETLTATLHVQPPTSQPAAAPVQPTQAANPPTPMCKVIHDYPIKYLTEVSTSEDGFLHVEFWVGGDAPEYETILPGGRYLLRTNFAGGHVWEYAGCTFEQVKTQVDAHISRRLAQEAKNGGYLEWQSTGYFAPVR